MNSADERAFSSCSTISMSRKGLAIAFLALLVGALLQSCAVKMMQDGGMSETSLHETAPELLEKYLKASDGYRLPYTLLTPELESEAVVIALHGFNDYSHAFQGMCEYFVDRSISCLAYDQRGFGDTKNHGAWHGADAMRKDLKEYVSTVAKRYPSLPIFLVGESMGGAVIMSALANDAAFYEESIAGAALLAPAVWARSTQPWYQRWALWLAVHTFPSWRPTGEGLGVQATDNIEALRKMYRDDKIIKETRIDSIYGLTNLMDEALAASPEVHGPLLVLYGELDEVIPKLPTCRMLAAMQFERQGITFKKYPRGYHMLSRDLQAEEVFRDLHAWINNTNIDVDQSRRDSQILCAEVD